ncbi:MAG: GDSL-type esterase/lipase family protein [Candidatus Woesearchaeota archaeon]|jgi:lysophospholipase L1-like esterase
MVRICIWGSSIAKGAGDPFRGGWVERLRNDFDKNMNDVSVYNLGISGNTSDLLVKRFNVEYDARLPSIVIIGIGLNDSAFFGKRTKPWVNLTKYEKNLYKLYNKAKKKSKVIFVTLTPVDESKTMPIPWREELYYSNDMISKYNEKLKLFCEKNSVSIINLEGLLTKKDMMDGLHPNSEGHRKIYVIVKKFLIDNKLVHKI